MAMIFENIKSRGSLQKFIRIIKVWKPETCSCRMCKKWKSETWSCRMCKTYVGNISFILLNMHLSLREKCPYTEFFLVRIQSECMKIRTRKNSVFRHFSHSVTLP